MPNYIRFSAEDLTSQISRGRRDFACRVEIKHCDLTGLKLNNMWFSRVDFGGSDLSGADLSASDLRGALFYKSKLIESDFRGANLENAYLSDADASGARFQEADLSHTRASNTCFLNCELHTAKNLNGLRITPETYTRSRWTPGYLSRLLELGAEITNLYSLPEDARDHVLARTSGLRMIFKGEFTVADQNSFRKAVATVLGEDGSTEVHFKASSHHTEVLVKSNDHYLPDAVAMITEALGFATMEQQLEEIRLGLPSRETIGSLADFLRDKENKELLDGFTPESVHGLYLVDKIIFSGRGKAILDAIDGLLKRQKQIRDELD